MSAQLPSQPASVFGRRRTALAAALGDTPALLFSGSQRARNYPANVFPFRADSHFLYLAGAAIPEAALLIHGGRTELFVPPKDDDDPLWHGPTPGPEHVTRATGVDAVRSRQELPAAIAAAGGGASMATLPSADPITRFDQCRLLGRAWPGDRTPGVDGLDPVDLGLADAMIALRLRHDEGALELIRRAVHGTTAAHLAGMAASRPGRFEHEVRAAMERELLARDMTTAYGSIVTVHGEILHATTYGNELREHDLLLADLGGELEGWANDVTRTWPVSGKFSPTQRALYDIVLQSQLDAIAMVRPGVRYRDVHLAAALTLARGLVDEGLLRGDPHALVERGAHALFFPHGVGHLLGLDVHDMEDLGDRAGYAPGRARSEQFGLGYLRLDRDLAPGMVVTIEPGIYLVPAILQRQALVGPFVADGTFDPARLERFSDVRGIRIEDDVLCTTTNPEVLTAAIPKEPQAVEIAVVG
ncbi:aminopeptidase P family protein [Paraliomyxa miuraensis]|uniref:aminopeptidase P family protein n=1 Tax=Paraliomyxa miuraensis TaxID=376150 RepID=UPI0022520673|nr:aminopeptidase P family protein [Paraliomyxa miuraensis]MCX4246581.1 aminopeptidase P family protein [Paraliomyxa miuraensis]